MKGTSSKLNTISHFDLLSDDNLYSILQFVGLRSYATFATLDTRCKSIFDSHDIPKQTFYGFLSVSEIDAFYESDESTDYTGKKTCLTQAIARGVAYYKNKELLEWSLEKKKSDVFLFDTMCILGTRAGNLDLLKSLFIENGESGEKELIQKRQRDICSASYTGLSLSCIASYHGHLHILKWLRGHGCAWDKAICNHAARNGHLSIIEWFNDEGEGCPWNEETCASAARGGHLEVLKFLRNNGCPWNSRTYTLASLFGHAHVSKWLRENGCPRNPYYGYV